MRLYRWILWIAIAGLVARLLFPAQMEGLTTSTEAKAKIQMYQNKDLIGQVPKKLEDLKASIMKEIKAIQSKITASTAQIKQNADGLHNIGKAHSAVASLNK